MGDPVEQDFWARFEEERRSSPAQAPAPWPVTLGLLLSGSVGGALLVWAARDWRRLELRLGMVVPGSWIFILSNEQLARQQRLAARGLGIRRAGDGPMPPAIRIGPLMAVSQGSELAYMWLRRHGRRPPVDVPGWFMAALVPELLLRWRWRGFAP
jgi:hypothetical protein